MRPESIPRCGWVGSEPLYRTYHDREWGVPVHDDRLLFEFLILEGAQAGLSWITILKKRDAYRAAFAGFDLEAVAGLKIQEEFGSFDTYQWRFVDGRPIRNAWRRMKEVPAGTSLIHKEEH
jgi:DNA-3-methyladenine glycosylase I